MQVNEWTRKHDDKCQYNYEINLSKKPLKYIMNDRMPAQPSQFYEDTGLYINGSHTSIKNVDVSNELRPEPTHLNNIQNLEARMYATSPYMGTGELIGTKDLSDVNSQLRGDATRLLNDKKPMTTYYTPGYLPNDPQVGAVLPDEWVMGGRSSRNDMRELYKKVCPQ